MDGGLNVFVGRLWLNFHNHGWTLWCCYLSCLHSWCGNLLSIQYREDVFMSCGRCLLLEVEMLWPVSYILRLVLYSTKKFHCLIPEGPKVWLLQMFNLGVEIVAE